MVRINYKEVSIVTQCPFCGRGNEVEVNENDYLDWQNGMMAQDAFPYLSADEREMLISGICPTCWDKMFGNDGKPDLQSIICMVLNGSEEPKLGVVDDYALEFMEHLED